MGVLDEGRESALNICALDECDRFLANVVVGDLDIVKLGWHDHLVLSGQAGFGKDMDNKDLDLISFERHGIIMI